MIDNLSLAQHPKHLHKKREVFQIVVATFGVGGFTHTGQPSPAAYGVACTTYDFRYPSVDRGARAG